MPNKESKTKRKSAEKPSVEEIEYYLDPLPGMFKTEIKEYFARLPDSIKTNKDFIKRAIAINYTIYDILGDTEKEDMDIVRVLIENNTEWYSKIPSYLLSNRELAMLACKSNHYAYNYIPSSLRNDYGFVKSILEQNGNIYKHLPTELREDVNLALIALESNPYIEVAKHIFDDPLIIPLIKKDPRYYILYKNVSERIRQDIGLARFIIRRNGSFYQYVATKLKDDLELAKIAIQEEVTNYKYISDRLKENRDLLLLALSHKDFFKFRIKEISTKWLDDFDIALICVVHDDMYIFDVSERLRKDFLFLKKVIENIDNHKIPSLYQLNPEPLSSNLELAQIAIVKNPDVYMELSKHLQAHRPFIDLCLSRNPDLFSHFPEDIRYDDTIARKIVTKDRLYLLPKTSLILRSDLPFLLSVIDPPNARLFKYASESILGNRETVLFLLSKKYKDVFLGITDELQEDVQFIESALKIEPSVSAYLTIAMYSNVKIVLQCLKTGFTDYTQIPADVLKNPIILQEILQFPHGTIPSPLKQALENNPGISHLIDKKLFFEMQAKGVNLVKSVTTKTLVSVWEEDSTIVTIMDDKTLNECVRLKPDLLQKYQTVVYRLSPHVLLDVIKKYKYLHTLVPFPVDVKKNMVSLTRNWIYKQNKPRLQRTPEHLLTETSIYRVHYENLGGNLFPIMTIPKGTYLYHYSGTNHSIKDRVYQTNPNVQNYFFPFPYVSHGVSLSYETCFICKTNRDLRVLCLIEPSPLNRSMKGNPKFCTYLETSFGYYNNTIKQCDKFDYDLCMDKDLMKKYDIQGNIAIARDDSISHGGIWHHFLHDNTVFGGQHTNTKIRDIFQTILNQCCLDSRISSEHNFVESTPYSIPSSLSKNDVFSIPEIVLSPLQTQYYDMESFPDDLEQLKKYMNYECLKVVTDIEELPILLDNLIRDVRRFSVYPILHMDQTVDAGNKQLFYKETYRKQKSDITMLQHLYNDKDRLSRKKNGGKGTQTVSSTIVETKPKDKVFKLVLQNKSLYEKVSLGEYEYWFSETKRHKIPIVYIKNINGSDNLTRRCKD